MTHAAQRAYRNLPTAVGSGGVPGEHSWVPTKKPASHQASIDQAFANAAITPAFWLGVSIGTGSLLMTPLLYADPTTSTKHLSFGHQMSMSHGAAADFNRRAIWKRQLESIKHDLSVSTTHLARFLCVERPTIYQWFGSAEPRQRNLNRISALADLAGTWHKLRLGYIRPYLDTHTTDDGISISDLLSSPELDAEQLAHHFERIAAQHHAIHRPAEQSLAEQLAARGFEPYDEETRKRSRAGSIRSTSPGEDSA